MPLYREEILHDRQVVGSTTPFETASTSFVDVDGALITTKDLSQPATYSSSLSVLAFGSLNNTVATFRATINGNPLGSEVPVALRNKDSDVGYTILGLVSDVASGDVLRLQCKTDKGTLTIVEYGILIDGIPSSRVL